MATPIGGNPSRSRGPHFHPECSPRARQDREHIGPSSLARAMIAFNSINYCRVATVQPQHVRWALVEPHGRLASRVTEAITSTAEPEAPPAAEDGLMGHEKGILCPGCTDEVPARDVPHRRPDARDPYDGPPPGRAPPGPAQLDPPGRGGPGRAGRPADHPWRRRNWPLYARTTPTSAGPPRSSRLPRLVSHRNSTRPGDVLKLIDEHQDRFGTKPVLPELRPTPSPAAPWQPAPPGPGAARPHHRRAEPVAGGRHLADADQ